MGAGQAGQLAHVWADEFTVHVLIGGQLVKTVPSSLDVEDLAVLKMRGASPAGPPPAAPAPALALAGALPGGTVIEVDRAVDGGGIADLAGQRVKIGAELARRRVTLRLDGHLMHVISGGVLAKTLPSPVPAADRAKLRGRPDRRGRTARAGSRPGQRSPQSPQRRRHHGHPPAAARRRQLRREDRHRSRRGHALPGHLRRCRDLPAPPAPSSTPSPGGKPRSTPRRPKPRPASPEPVRHVVSRNCQASPETTHHNSNPAVR
jgi:hypothetical protein